MIGKNFRDQSGRHRAEEAGHRRKHGWAGERRHGVFLGGVFGRRIRAWRRWGEHSVRAALAPDARNGSLGELAPPIPATASKNKDARPHVLSSFRHPPCLLPPRAPCLPPQAGTVSAAASCRALADGKREGGREKARPFSFTDAQKRVPPRGERNGRVALPRDHMGGKLLGSYRKPQTAPEGAAGAS